MMYEIYWTDEGKETFDQTISTIEDRWGFKQASLFAKRVQDILTLISTQPYLYKSSFTQNLRQAIISKQTSLFYEVTESRIVVLFFFDNRQEPLFDLG